jgi:hypothetical protein
VDADGLEEHADLSPVLKYVGSGTVSVAGSEVVGSKTVGISPLSMLTCLYSEGGGACQYPPTPLQSTQCALFHFRDL